LPKVRSGAWRTLAGRVFLLLPFLLMVFFIGLISSRFRPVSLTDTYQQTEIRYAADRQWVLFPGDCVQVSWTLSNAVSATFFPKLEPGISSGKGVRLIFFQKEDSFGPSITEDAPGGTTEHFTGSETISRSAPGCIDYMTEPKLRVHFADDTSRTYKLGLDALFLRIETWVFVAMAVISIYLGAWLLGRASRFDVARHTLWLSIPFLIVYGAALLHFPNFLSTYWLDAIIYFGLVTAVIAASLFSVMQPERFKQSLLQLWQALPIRLAVGVFWLWILAFGYTLPRPSFVKELFWLPLFLWALLVGSLVLWNSRSSEIALASSAHSRRSRLLIALLCMGIALARDIVLFQTYSVAVFPDSASYVQGGNALFSAGASQGLPMRIFPYLMINAVAQSSVSPLPLLILQAMIGALAIGLLAYVLTYKHLWFGAATGILLALNLPWGTYNRSILTESAFTSFHVLCFALVIWHSQRRHTLSLGELFLFGALCGWTFLFRGTGLPLIIPVLLVYYFLTRTWVKPLAILAGFTIFLLGVAAFNQWRYGEFGLVGPQQGTLASALFSYHLFSPENGPVSQEMDAALRSCMGYIDYDDVPRFSSNFIFHHFGRCLDPLWGVEQVTAATSKSLVELIRQRPFEFARTLIEEAGNGLAIASNSEFYTVSYLATAPERYLRCGRPYRTWCKDFPKADPPPERPILTDLNHALTYPNQIYLAVEQISSRSSVVMLFAFLMLSSFLWMSTNDKFIVVICVGFVFYQLLTVSVAHVFFPRYGVVLGSFFTVLSVMAIGGAVRQFRIGRLRPTLLGLGLLALILIYLAWANGTLRRAVTAPVLGRIDINLLQKYGMTDLDFAVYRELLDRSTSAFSPAANPEFPGILWHYGTLYQPFDLLASGQSRVKGWEFTRLPGYLRDVGASYLLLDAQQWASLPPPDQAILNDPAHYRLIGEWHDADDSRRLFEIVGDARGTYPAHDQNGVVIFEQPDRSLGVYRLDADRNGVFITHIDFAAVQSGALRFEGEGGWTVELQPSPTGGYKLQVHDATGEVVDDSFIVHLP
jgi:hypothetical protein